MTNPLLEMAAQALYEEPAAMDRADFTSWVRLPAERRQPWLDDAQRVFDAIGMDNAECQTCSHLRNRLDSISRMAVVTDKDDIESIVTIIDLIRNKALPTEGRGK